MHKIIFARSAYRSLYLLPDHIVKKLKSWTAQVEFLGLSEVRKRPGFHDEPLKGKRKGQRSVRLSRSYRAIYEESKDGNIHIVTIIEVNKHAY